jgi:hypothetical protein
LLKTLGIMLKADSLRSAKKGIASQALGQIKKLEECLVHAQRELDLSRDGDIFSFTPIPLITYLESCQACTSKDCKRRPLDPHRLLSLDDEVPLPNLQTLEPACDPQLFPESLTPACFPQYPSSVLPQASPSNINHPTKPTRFDQATATFIKMASSSTPKTPLL